MLNLCNNLEIELIHIDKRVRDAGEYKYREGEAKGHKMAESVAVLQLLSYSKF